MNVPPEVIKAAWEQYRDMADLTSKPALYLAGISVFDFLFTEEEPAVITYEVITYSDRIVVEAEGVIVETLCQFVAS